MVNKDVRGYYEILENPELKKILNQCGGIVYAKMGGHPFWPSRVCELDEWMRMVKHRHRASQVCVYFFGSNNFGWIAANCVSIFTEKPPVSKVTKKFVNTKAFQRGMEEANLLLKHAKNFNDVAFWDRVMANKKEQQTARCEKCGITEENDIRIICDGPDCNREYHLTCLSPPMINVPQGEWTCPVCCSDLGILYPRPKPASLPIYTPGKPSSFFDGSKVPMLPPKKQLLSTKKHSTGSGKVIIPSYKAGGSYVNQSSNIPIGTEATNSSSLTPKRRHLEVKDSSEKKKRKKTNTSFQHLNGEEENRDIEESEERCFLCSYGGELVVCEFPKCTKVYHQFCLGAFPFPKDSEETWYCPRHVCVKTGKREEDFVFPSSTPPLSTSPGTTLPKKIENTKTPSNSFLDLNSFRSTFPAPAPPSAPANTLLSTTSRKRTSLGNDQKKHLLWKCRQCPVAVADEALPTELFKNLRKSHNAISPRGNSSGGFQSSFVAPLKNYSRKDRSFVCPNCSVPRGRLKLAQTLEKIWSCVATNRQGLPFLGPLLAGAVDEKSSKDKMDLFQILFKIRGLQYVHVDGFLHDIKLMAQQAKQLIANRSTPLVESVDTLVLVVCTQCSYYREELSRLKKVIQGDVVSAIEKVKNISTTANCLNTTPSDSSNLVIDLTGEDEDDDDKDKGQEMPNDEAVEGKSEMICSQSYVDCWDIPWRKECKPFGEKNYVAIDMRTLSEWTAYVTMSPSFVSIPKKRPNPRMSSLNVSCNQMATDTINFANDDINSQEKNSFSNCSSSSSDNNRNGVNVHEQPIHPQIQPEQHHHIEDNNIVDNGERKTCVELSRSEEIDIILALKELQKHNGVEKFRTSDNEELELSGSDFFLSPSLVEMKEMFRQQSELIRRVMRNQATLKKAWEISQLALYTTSTRTSQSPNGGEDDDVVVTLGEGRLARELRLANKNLHNRLASKDKLVEELIKDQKETYQKMLYYESENKKLSESVKCLEEKLSDKPKDFTPDFVRRSSRAATMNITASSSSNK